jgi:hypothetical protein
MTHPVTEPGLSPLDLIARQQDTIDNLATAIDLLQDQVATLRRRIQALEGVPFPENEPPS